MKPNDLESMTTHEFAGLISCFLTPGNLESMTTDALAELVSSIVLVLRRLPNVPLGELSSLADNIADSNRAPERNQKPYEVYEGIPVYLYQEERSDEWKASVEWYGRLADVDLEEGEKPTRETVIRAAQRLINLLADTRDNGVVWPESHFLRK